MSKSKKVTINNTQLLADTGLRVRHFNLRRLGARPMTVAYRDNGTTIEVATAVTHPKDVFCKKIGTKTAIEHFLAGKVATLPKADPFGSGRGFPAGETLRVMFG